MCLSISLYMGWIYVVIKVKRNALTRLGKVKLYKYSVSNCNYP